MGGLWFMLNWTQRPPEAVKVPTVIPFADFFSQYLLRAMPVTDGFDFPVRPPDAAGVFVTLGFQEENHLGEDWNTAPGDKDLGEPVYSIADGWVTMAIDFEGMWGKVVMIAHRMPVGSRPTAVESMYAHLDTLTVKSGEFVKRGQKIGTIGNAGGYYKAHLHWELRSVVGLGLGGGFSERYDGWLNPSDFIAAHRPAGVTRPPQWKKLPVKQRAVWGFDG